MDVPDPPSTLLLVGLLCLLPFGLLTRTLTLLRLWDDLSLFLTMIYTLSLSMLFLLLCAMIHFFIVFFSASLCRRVNVKVRPPPAWENWISAFRLLSRARVLTKKAHALTHRSNNTTRSSSSVYGETLVFVVVVFFRASVSVRSQEYERETCAD